MVVGGAWAGVVAPPLLRYHKCECSGLLPRVIRVRVFSFASICLGPGHFSRLRLNGRAFSEKQ
jgi:hypothetical protein